MKQNIPIFLLFGIVLFACVDSMPVSRVAVAPSSIPDGYKLIGKVAWGDDAGCVLEATLIESRMSLARLPKNAPKHVLEIRNVSVDKTLLSESGGEGALSIVTGEIGDGSAKFVLTSLSAGSADVARVFQVQCDSVKKVFDEAYRDVFWSMNSYQKDDVGFFLFSADNLTEYDNKLMIQRWRWVGSGFEKDGMLSNEAFNRLVETSFRSHH
ncbi:MAG: hypothetical protein K1X52_14890 [Pyrinomonadaceae bacterium]|jgi:hypothetical protein|nr:hypothetical protein [Pyrinomonadaceae bacterium]